MRSKRMVGLCLAALASLSLGNGAAGDAVEAKGTIESVTVYRGQALVTRVVVLDAAGGVADLVVTDLPAQIVPDSLYASAEGDVQIRAVRYRTRAVKDEPRPEVRKLNEQIEELNRKLRENQTLQGLLAKKEAYLGSLEKFSTTKIKDELNKGTLKVEALKGLSQFLFEQRGEIVTGNLKLAEARRKLQEQVNLLSRKRAELTKRSSRTARDWVLR